MRPDRSLRLAKEVERTLTCAPPPPPLHPSYGLLDSDDEEEPHPAAGRQHPGRPDDGGETSSDGDEQLGLRRAPPTGGRMPAGPARGGEADVEGDDGSLMAGSSKRAAAGAPAATVARTPQLG